MSASTNPAPKPVPPVRRITISDIARLHADGSRIAMLTAYDYPTARLIDEAGIPLILVGDSLGQVVLGYDRTSPRHDGRDAPPHQGRRPRHRSGARHRRHALPVLRDAGAGRPERRPVPGRGRGPGRQGRGRRRSARTIEAITRAGIPVMGHIGLTPQAINADRPGADPGQDPRGRPGPAGRCPRASRRPVRSRSSWSSSRNSSPRRSPSGSRSRRSASAPAPAAAARSRSSPTCSASRTGSPRHARTYADLREDDPGRDPRLQGRRRGRHVPGPGRDGPDGRRRARRGARRLRPRPAEPDDRRPAASRSTATCRERDPRRAHPRRAARGARRRPPAGRPRADDGLAPRRPPLADAAGRGPTTPTAVVTIFVNPRQFNRADDFTQYPRNEARDLAICADEGVDLVWAPPVDEVYVPGFDTTVTVGAIAGPLEGAARPGHFDGVATVVAILFGLVGAEHAYFGQKDAQQVMVIRRMARDLALPTEVDRLPHRARAGRPGALVAQRPPLARASGPRRRCSIARCWRRPSAGRPASARATRCGPRCGDPVGRAAGRRPSTSRRPTR